MVVSPFKWSLLDHSYGTINDQRMNAYEYYEAKEKLEMQKGLVQKSKQTPSLYKAELLKFIELLITVKGHALCMDVKRERKRISRLIVEGLMGI